MRTFAGLLPNPEETALPVLQGTSFVLHSAETDQTGANGIFDRFPVVSMVLMLLIVLAFFLARWVMRNAAVLEYVKQPSK